LFQHGDGLKLNICDKRSVRNFRMALESNLYVKHQRRHPPTPPTVVLNDTSKPVQPTSTVDPLKSNQTERFVRRALCNNFLKLVDFKNYIVKK